MTFGTLRKCRGVFNTRQINGAADLSPKLKHITELPEQDSNTAVVEPSWKSGGILTSQRSSVFQTAKRPPHAVKGTDAIQNRTCGKCQLWQEPHWAERRTEHHDRAQRTSSSTVLVPATLLWACLAWQPRFALSKVKMAEESEMASHCVGKALSLHLWHLTWGVCVGGGQGRITRKCKWVTQIFWWEFWSRRVTEDESQSLAQSRQRCYN